MWETLAAINVYGKRNTHNGVVRAAAHGLWPGSYIAYNSSFPAGK